MTEQKRLCDAQIAEIQKHRWVESVKAGRDVGASWAAADWIKKYAVQFRAAWSQEKRKEESGRVQKKN